MIFLVTVVILLLTTSVHCQLQTTYLNANSSFVSLQRWDMEPAGALSFRIRTFQLNAFLLYMESDAGTIIYLELFNGQVRMTLSDGRTVTLTRPFNTNSFRGLQLVRSAGSLDLMDVDFNQTVPVPFNGPFNVVDPVYVAGIDPSINPNNLSYPDATVQPHFVGCIDEFQIGDGSITTTVLSDNSVLGNSTDVIFGACSGQCSTLNCNGGDCIEYYTRAECNCGPVSEGDGDVCNSEDRILLYDGSFYSCFMLPQYGSPYPYSENETIRVFLQEVPLRATLMTGRQEDYRFNLYLLNSFVYYELKRGDVTLVDLRTDSTLNTGGQLVILRTENDIAISYQGTPIGMATITAEELATLRFTDICVGGGFFDFPVIASPLRNVHYNFYALFDNEAEYGERNVSTIRRVNFVDPSASISLPGNLALDSATRVVISFRTLQQNAILLHSEDSDNYFRVAINNSLLLVTTSFGGAEATDLCNDVTISRYEWYSVVIEPIIMAADASPEVGVNLERLTSGQAFSTCRISNSILNSFSSFPLVLGGSAADVDGLVGCVELDYNMRMLSFDTVVSSVIVTDNCEPCSISPCMNGGMCINIDDREFNCSCADPFFGRFCELMMTSSSTPVITSSSTPVMTSLVVPTTTTIIPTSSPSPSSSTPSPTPSSTSTQQETTTPVVPTSTTMSITNMTTTTTPTRTVSDDGGGDDSNLGAIIGIVLAIVVGLLLLLLVILVIIVVIRNRNNRQGFYQTYEGKGGDEMILKYSASLRSVTKPDTSTENGGTINRGGSVKKEQEYFI